MFTKTINLRLFTDNPVIVHNQRTLRVIRGPTRKQSAEVLEVFQTTDEPTSVNNNSNNNNNNILEHLIAMIFTNRLIVKFGD